MTVRSVRSIQGNQERVREKRLNWVLCMEGFHLGFNVIHIYVKAAKKSTRDIVIEKVRDRSCCVIHARHLF